MSTLMTLARPILLYDNDCGICSRFAHIAERTSKGWIDTVGLFTRRGVTIKSDFFGPEDRPDDNFWLLVGAEWLGESHEGSPFSHLNNNLLHLHMMNTTMNRQQPKTIHTDMNSTMISLQHNNLSLRSNLKPKTTSHSQKQT